MPGQNRQALSVSSPKSSFPLGNSNLPGLGNAQGPSKSLFDFSLPDVVQSLLDQEKNLTLGISVSRREKCVDPTSSGGMEVAHIWEKPIAIKDNSFVFRNVRYTIVAELDSWCESGAWWHGEPVLYFSLVKTDPEGLLK